LAVQDFELSDVEWASLRLPVDLAFFFYNTPDERVVAYYPSPMGPTESLLKLTTWADMAANNPILQEMVQDVEALLVNRAKEARQYLLVPIDDCYRLVALLRTQWRGFSGGPEVWATRRLQQKRETIRIDEDHFRKTLDERGLSADAIRARDTVFRALPEDDLAFLASYRQSETILRGTQAVTRSEARLDEAQLAEIVRLRAEGARLAILPLVVAATGLFGSVAIRLLAPPPISPHLLLSIGFVAAVAGCYLLWRTRTLRESERVELVESFERKQAQMETIDRDAKQFVGRLGTVAQACRLTSPTQALNQYTDWMAPRSEVDQLERFRRREEELQLETAGVREKLGSFIGGDPSTLDLNDSRLGDLDAIYQDYVRFFELRRQQEEIESRRSAIEEDLAAIENEKSDLREKIFEVLEEAGVERDRELDEAIELFALRQGQTPGDAWAGTLPELNPEWVAGLSARMEAIIRRFLPEARNVEIDGNLSPSLRFESKVPAVPYRELKQQVSPATIDMVCLALRLAIVETLSSSGERIPVILDDPLVRTDDARHDRALDFLVTDASERNQIVLLTAQEVKSRWFLHQFPKHRERVTPIHDASPDSSSVSSSSVRSAS
jgi:hypothetical protein